MAYRSNGIGEFSFREGINPKEAIDILNQYGIENSSESSYPEEETFFLSFEDQKMYDKEFQTGLKKLSEFCNGKFEIEGDDRDDYYKLIFEDGEITIRYPVLKWSLPEKYIFPPQLLSKTNEK